MAFDGAVGVIPFSRPHPAPASLENLRSVLESDHAHGDGPFTMAASERLRAITGGGEVLLTTSGTHALEMASRLLDLTPDDEVILPSFTFSSAAAAVAMTGARIVFVDIDAATGNIDPAQVAEAVTPRTRAISVMHYGGQPVDMAAITSIAAHHGLPVIEDNAHGLGVVTDDGVLGRMGDLGIQSFHDTKNVHAGEGGALLINDPGHVERAEIMREKGTNRSQFLRGAVDKYSWVDWGSSYLPSEFNAAVLSAQLDEFDTIQAARHKIWDRYATGLADWAGLVGATLMRPPRGIHAAHLFFLLLGRWSDQGELITFLRSRGIVAAFHYVPLDTSTAGQRYGRALRPLDRSEDFSRRLVRLPLWAGMTDAQVERVIAAVCEWRPTMEDV
ncbi:dTDP-4-amino-4,6-dideoxygalactose transaminase [Agromyces laixinhei]|uniref:dTDP-4-amino-4,6-dideoxygalactose transaminase n=1 Tax=Agromyces laixinhei TaxID=2585717 RepID=UPI0012ED7166|nr:dTDP-4-amino-4,6-dideoxygalactose transaminase [Agromyces laixinhei]